MKLFFDGGCKPNPGMMEIAVVTEDRRIRKHERLHYGTNNEAEWIAFLWAVETALANFPDEPITISGDSNLVIQQALGNWKVKQDTLKPYLTHFQSVKGQFKKPLTLTHVRRNFNPAGHYIEEIHK